MQIINHQEYSYAADIYSLGIVMWEIFTCCIPYDGDAQGFSLMQCVGGGPSAVDASAGESSVVTARVSQRNAPTT